MEIKFADRYVAFIDVLGFKELVHASNSEVRLSEYFGVVEKQLEGLTHRKVDLEKLLISDAIVLMHPVDSGVTSLREICFAIARIQYELALMGIWLRGGLTKGRIYFDADKNIVAGPALVKAFALENQSKFPRVIIDPNLVEVHRTTRQGLIESLNRHDVEDWTSVAYDDRRTEVVNEVFGADALFVDYLSPLHQNSNLDKERLFSAVKNAMYQDQRHYKKYRWLVDYIACSLPNGPPDDYKSRLQAL